MKFGFRHLIRLLLVVLIGTTAVHATTWDEPWHDAVIRIADTFIKVKITAVSGAEAKAEVLSFLAGTKTTPTIRIRCCSSLRYISISGNHELELPFEIGKEFYLFVKKNEKDGIYQLPTPTSGWAVVNGDSVYATYRHSYHKAAVPIDIYEKTSVAIFDGIKGNPIDRTSIIKFVQDQLSEKPAKLLDDVTSDESKKFFLQHVALETSYHLGINIDLAMLMPFVNAAIPHTQISACRALGKLSSPESKEVLMKFIEGKGFGFAKVMCVWGLKDLKAIEMTKRLEAFIANGTDVETGFGGSIMDPRIATAFPGSVKNSISILLAEWKQSPKSKTTKN